jgi:Uma2 family endonuclease
MNEQLRPASLPATTRAAEGLPRRRWSVAEIEAMVAKGILAEDERFELIGGEVVPMSPKGARHELVKKVLQQFWFPLVANSPIDLITETTLRVAKDAFLEPDFLFWPRSVALKDVTAASTLLLVEVADTSLGYDLGMKALTYARLGLPELWVINAKTLDTRIHRGPTDSGYTETSDCSANVPLTPQAAPELAVLLSELDLG